jgi:enoyl-CoA hydratase
LIRTLTLPGEAGTRFSWALLASVTEQLSAWAQDGSVRAVVVESAARDFSHGADLKDPEMAGRILGGRPGGIEVGDAGARMISALLALPCPSVVALQGRVIGAGAVLMTVADFRFAAPGTLVSFPEVDRAMHLGWGAIPHMVREFGAPLTRALVMACEPVPVEQFPPHVFRIVDDPKAAAQSFAAGLAAKPPVALRAVKQVLQRVAGTADMYTLDDSELFADTLETDDFREAMMAFLERRPAVFKGR